MSSGFIVMHDLRALHKKKKALAKNSDRLKQQNYTKNQLSTPNPIKL